MSIQLVLYPQNYAGYVDLGAPQTSNLAADPTDFNSLPLTPLTLAVWGAPFGMGQGYTISQQLGGLTSNWGSAITPAIATPPTRNYNAGLLTWEVKMYGAASGDPQQAFVFQKLTGLTPGKNYQCRVKTSIPYPEGINIDHLLFNIMNSSFQTGNPTGATWGPLTGTSSTGWTQPVSWLCANSEENLYLRWVSFDGTTPYAFSEVEVMEVQSNIFSDGQVICDLYNEQEIPITLSVDSFKNAGEKQQSYSKAFKLPATKHNNKIFENIFDFTRSGSSIPLFNPYQQTRAIYKQNGVVIFQGFMRLINIQEKNGERSYNVNLYSETTTLATLLKAKTFADLTSNLEELNHSYNRTQIQNSWYGALDLTTALSNPNEFAGVVGATTTDVLRYPFVDWTGTMRAVASANQEANGAVSGYPSMSRLSDAFRPWINLKYLIQNIFSNAGFTYTSAFLNGSYFSELFMDFNWGSDANPSNLGAEGQSIFLPTDPAQPMVGLTYYTVQFPSSASFPASAGYDATTGIFTAPNNNTTYTLNADIWFASNDDGAQFILKFKCSDASQTQFFPMQVINSGDQGQFTGQFTATLQAGDTLFFQAAIQANAAHTGNVQAVSRIWGGADIVGAVPGGLLNTLRGELNQWDFFKGIVTMFNLIIMQDKANPNNLVIEPYKDVFTTTPFDVIHDWTEKLDTADLKLEPMKLKQVTTFQYTEDKDYPFAVYKKATGGYNYGSMKWTVPGYTLVEGEQKIEAKPFAATVIKPFFDYFAQFLGPVIYGSNEEGTEFQGIDNKPRIMYNVSGNTPYTISGGPPALTYYIPWQNGVSGANQFSYGLFAHTDAIPSTNTDTDLNFGPCQFINGVGVAPTTNLFSEYYQDYFYELYHPDTRTLKVKVLLNESDVSAFDFSDKIRLKNRLYRVDKINYKPNQLSTVELILLP